MKTTGIALLVIGILITVFTGFNFFTKKKVVDIGNLEISRDKKHSVEWSPIVGVVVMIVGGGIYLYGTKKQ
ncbi:MAG: hypothetical protein SH857_07770 [Chitinophagales bacterium]|nr:hypothetical protein [Chitinophagales bacterium]